jgi:hypothetical protein
MIKLLLFHKKYSLNNLVSFFYEVSKDNLTSIGFQNISNVDQIIFTEIVIPQLLEVAKDKGIKSTS